MPKLDPVDKEIRDFFKKHRSSHYFQKQLKILNDEVAEEESDDDKRRSLSIVKNGLAADAIHAANQALKKILSTGSAKECKVIASGAIESIASIEASGISSGVALGLTDEWISEQYHRNVAVVGENSPIDFLRAFSFRVLQHFGDYAGFYRATSENFERLKKSEKQNS